MQIRVMDAERSHTRIGWAADGEAANCKQRVIKKVVSTYPTTHGRRLTGPPMQGVSVHDESGKVRTLCLTPNGSLELVKGLLGGLLDSAITMAADDEFRAVLAQVNAAVALQDQDATDAVRAMRERFDP